MAGHCTTAAGRAAPAAVLDPAIHQGHVGRRPRGPQPTNSRPACSPGRVGPAASAERSRLAMVLCPMLANAYSPDSAIVYRDNSERWGNHWELGGASTFGAGAGVPTTPDVTCMHKVPARAR